MATDMTQNAAFLALVQNAGTGAQSTITSQTPGNGGPSTQPDGDATSQKLHQMLVAASILTAVIIVLVVVAGFSNNAGNTVIGLLSLILLVQGITKVNPFVQWIAKHQLTPSTAGIGDSIAKG